MVGLCHIRLYRKPLLGNFYLSAFLMGLVFSLYVNGWLILV